MKAIASVTFTVQISWDVARVMTESPILSEVRKQCAELAAQFIEDGIRRADTKILVRSITPYSAAKVAVSVTPDVQQIDLIGI